MKKIGTILSTIISLVCLFYYTINYYQKGELILGREHFGLWLGFVIVTSTLLILGVLTLFAVESVKKKNEELTKLIEKLIDITEENHDEVFEMMINSRELGIDIMNKNDKGND